MNTQKQKFTSIALVIIAGLLTIGSCSKKNEDLVPVVSLLTSGDSTAILFSDTLRIQGSATDNEGLHELAVLITAPAGDTVFTDAPYVHNLKSFAFSYKYKPTSSGNLTVNVVAINHREKVTKVTRLVTVL